MIIENQGKNGKNEPRINDLMSSKYEVSWLSLRRKFIVDINLIIDSVLCFRWNPLSSM